MNTLNAQHAKKQRKFLDDHKVKYTARDIKAENPTAEEIAAWYPQSGKDLKAFFNTSGMIYREQQLKDKLPNLSEEEKVAYVAEREAAGIIPTVRLAVE